MPGLVIPSRQLRLPPSWSLRTLSTQRLSSGGPGPARSLGQCQAVWALGTAGNSQAWTPPSWSSAFQSPPPASLFRNSGCIHPTLGANPCLSSRVPSSSTHPPHRPPPHHPPPHRPALHRPAPLRPPPYHPALHHPAPYRPALWEPQHCFPRSLLTSALALVIRVNM